METPKQPRFFYGWVMVAAGVIVVAAAIGLVANTFPIYIVPVGKELGLSRSQMSLNQTLFAAGMMVVQFFWGPVFSRLKLMKTMRISAVLTCVGYLLYAFAESAWQFLAIIAVLAVTMAFLSWMPLTVIISNWFYEKRGLALGIAFMGSGVGGMLFNALGGVLVSRVGWRTTVLIYTGALCVMLLPTVFFLLKLKPEDMGLLPYGQTHVQAERTEAGGFTLSQALRSRVFLPICLCCLVTGFTNNSLNATINPHLQHMGYSGVFAAGVASAYLAALAAGKIVLGQISDRAGATRATALALCAMVLSSCGMLGARLLPVALCTVPIMGLGNAFGSVGFPLISRSVFGERDHAAITGVLSAVNGVGSTIGPILCGLIFDLNGSYYLAYLAMAVLLIPLGTLMVCAMHKHTQKTTP